MTTESDANKPARKRMAIFRGADAPALHIEEFLGIDETVMAKMAFQGEAMQNGVVPEVTNVLFKGAGLSLTQAWFKSGYTVPRHSHDADCTYYILSGSVRFGTQVLTAGDGIFVPGGDAYTLEAGDEGAEFLEFRTAETFNMKFVNNDDAHYKKMSDAFANNAERWATEKRPSELV